MLYYKSLVLSLFISFLLYSSIVLFANKNSFDFLIMHNETYTIEKHNSFFECKDKNPNYREMFNCYDFIENRNIGFYDEIKNNLLVYLIYVLLFINLWVSVFIYIDLKYFDRKVNVFDYYLIDWSVKTAPLLGILGTVISLAIVVNGNESGDLKKLFVENFKNAALTTILGGFIYIINLKLSNYINTKIDLAYEKS